MSATADPDWQSAALAKIRAGEYAIRETANRLRARNRAAALVTTWSEQGVEVRAAADQVASDGAAGLSLRTAGVSRGGRRQAVAAPAFQLGQCRNDGATDELGQCLRRAEANNSGLVEWWENRPDALEQGFELAAPPLGQGGAPLRIELQISAKHVETDAAGTAATIETMDGRALRYGQLQATDARGAALAIRLRQTGSSLALEIADQEAVYPIHVDPLLTPATWLGESDQGAALLGWSVASAGDIDNDGYGDIIAGAPSYDTGFSDAGKIFIYYGSASGPSATPDQFSPSGSAAGDRLGYAVAAAGDVDKDGFGDLLVAAPFHDGVGTDSGQVYLYKGAAGHVGLTTIATLDGTQANSQFGAALAGVGDLNKDLVGDFVIGAPLYDGSNTDQGRVYVYRGTASGPPTTPTILERNTTSAHFGASVAGAGDVNGDQYGDVVVGAPGFTNPEVSEGAAFVYHGGSQGILNGATANAVLEKNQANAALGTSVASAGDFDGDGYADIVIGAPQYDHPETDEGVAFVYKGSAQGISTSNPWLLESNLGSALFGYSVASAGDFNGDGRGDVVIGARGYTSGQSIEGQVSVYTMGATAPALYSQFESDQANAMLGFSVASAGDVNGDGFSDVLGGAPFYSDGATYEGRAFLFYGGPTRLLQLSSSWAPEGSGVEAQLGHSVTNAGDLNGDGYDDVVVGAPGYADQGYCFVYYGSATGLPTTANRTLTLAQPQTNAQFCLSVSGAGDVNGDGYADLIVGAPGYSHPQTNEGGAFVFLGSVNGLSGTASWITETDQPSAAFGYSVTGAGDLNGDGLADVAIGAPDFSSDLTNEGAVFVFYGSTSSVLDTNNRTLREGNQQGCLYGHSVAAAGDVNRDGFGDLIVGAPLFQSDQGQEGRAFVYHGSATGISATNAENWKTESNSDQSAYGYCVAGVGDLNGDGYGDVAVGAPNYTGPESLEGKVFVYVGSSTGLHGNGTNVPDWSREPNATNFSSGALVAPAGDVNGDGLGDMLFGEPSALNLGMLWIAYGSKSNVVGSLNSIIGQGGEFLGFAAAGADVDGDGYSDVIVGSPLYNTSMHVGRAQIMLSGGIPLLPQARRANLTTPITPHGSSVTTGFDAALLAPRVPMGTARVKLQVEAKNLGTAFNGASLATSAWVEVDRASAVLKRLVSGTSGNRKHFRMRLFYDPSRALPWFQHSRWIYGGQKGESAGVHVRIP